MPGLRCQPAKVHEGGVVAGRLGILNATLTAHPPERRGRAPDDRLDEVQARRSRPPLARRQSQHSHEWALTVAGDMMVHVPDTLADLIASAPLFRRLAPADRKRLEAVAELKRYGRGDVIFSEGDPSSVFITIASGRVKVSKGTPGGKDLILDLLGAGDPLGAVAAYEGRPFPASAVALEHTTCVVVPRREFLALLEQYPSVARGLLLSLTYRLMEILRRMSELTGSHVEPRFARLFLKMARELGHPDGPQVVIPVALTRQELADLTGTTIETCIRLMSRWNKQAIVKTEKGRFVVADVKALQNLAQE